MNASKEGVPSLKGGSVLGSSVSPAPFCLCLVMSNFDEELLAMTTSHSAQYSSYHFLTKICC